MDKLKTGLLIVTPILVIVVVVLAVMAGGWTNSPEPTYNLAQIYVTNWDTNSSEGDVFDVQFRISIDTNNDGVFEYVKTSPLMSNTNYEMSPFRTGGLLSTDVSTFQFKVEVFRVVDGVQVPQYYTDDATVPLNTGINNMEASDIWSFDATVAHPMDPNFCRFGYSYYFLA
jgi:hypothetical protein